MGDLILLKKRKAEVEKMEDLSSMLARAIKTSKKATGNIRKGIFAPSVSLRELLVSKFNQVLLEEKIIDSEIFRCALYVAKLFEAISKEVPESYYGTDYWIRGWQKDDPELFKKGGDACCLVCTFFGEFAERRTSVSDFQKMGSYLYRLYYFQTNETIGWCMSNNFKSIVQVAKEGINLL